MNILFINTINYIEHRNSEEYIWDKSKNKVYEHCSCCCPDVERKKCLYHSKGDDIEKILKQTTFDDCSMFGCSPFILYKYCD